MAAGHTHLSLDAAIIAPATRVRIAFRRSGGRTWDVCRWADRFEVITADEWTRNGERDYEFSSAFYATEAEALAAAGIEVLALAVAA